MKTAVSKLVAEILQTAALGTISTDLFYMALGPDDKNDQIVIYDNEGFTSQLPEQFEQPAFQVVVRGDKDADAEVAYNRARAIYEFLILFTGGVEFTGFEPIGSINALGRDENTRPQFTMNFYAFRNST